MEDCSAALDTDESYLKPLIKRARLRLELEQYEEAVRDFEQACERDSGNRDLQVQKKERRGEKWEKERNNKGKKGKEERRERGGGAQRQYQEREDVFARERARDCMCVRVIRAKGKRGATKSFVPNSRFVFRSSALYFSHSLFSSSSSSSSSLCIFRHGSGSCKTPSWS